MLRFKPYKPFIIGDITFVHPNDLYSIEDEEDNYVGCVYYSVIRGVYVVSIKCQCVVFNTITSIKDFLSIAY